jgi:periplasmic protein TonB
MPSHRILFALSLSVFLHLMAFGVGDLLCRVQVKRHFPIPNVIDATLRIPVPEMPPLDSLLKDTLSEAKPTPVKEKETRPEKPDGRRIAHLAAQRKLATHVYYPQEAIDAGIEGNVRLLLTLDDDGLIQDVQLAAGSGHAILDQAAIRAAWATRTLPGVGQRELMLPVTFRLQP